MLISLKVLNLYDSCIGRGISIFQLSKAGFRHKQNQTAAGSYEQGLRKNGTPLCAMRNIVTLLHTLACSVKTIDVSQVCKKINETHGTYPSTRVFLLLLLTGCLVTWENHVRVFSLPTL